MTHIVLTSKPAHQSGLDSYFFFLAIVCNELNFA